MNDVTSHLAYSTNSPIHREVLQIGERVRAQQERVADRSQRSVSITVSRFRSEADQESALALIHELPTSECDIQVDLTAFRIVPIKLYGALVAAGCSATRNGRRLTLQLHPSATTGEWDESGVLFAANPALSSGFCVHFGMQRHHAAPTTDLAELERRLMQLKFRYRLPSIRDLAHR